MSALWLAECPMFDQGLVRPLITEAGTIVLFCDSCGTAWLGPDGLEQENCVQPEPPDWQVAGELHIRPGTTRWAERADLAGEPWSSVSWHESGEI